jgi:prolyl-tRNA synthetase
MSLLFGQTLREAPSEAEGGGHRLLVRAGFIRQLAPGIFGYLPLARRSLSKLESILRAEINAIGGQELAMPVMYLATMKDTGREHRTGAEAGRFEDDAGHDAISAMTREEVVAGLAAGEIRSYRQLPRLIYHMQTEWRNDPRPRAGLIRAREFTTLKSYSLDAGPEGLDAQYRAHYRACLRIFSRCALPVVAVASHMGVADGNIMAHEFVYLTPAGESALVLCDRCGYAANRQIATFRKVPLPPEPPRPVEKVPTPGVTTIEALARFLGVPQARTARALFMVATIPGEGREVDRPVLAVVRGDMAVNETKLAGALGAKALALAREDDIRAWGAVPGYASPVGVGEAVIVVVDDLIPGSSNLVAGANEQGYHLLNVNYGRDYKAHIVADIALADEGCPCPDCGEGVTLSTGAGVGYMFKAGTRYSKASGATFLDRQGRPQPIFMGSYGIGMDRLLACIAEEHHDERGLIWPISVAPYEVHLVSLASGDSVAGGQGRGQAGEVAEELYNRLQAGGVEVLYDDRAESPGVKFADADLIGVPLRLTVGERSLARGGVELKRRAAGEGVIVPVDGAVDRVRVEIASLYAEIEASVVEEPGAGDC